jgi:hypothetical protein
LPEQRRDGASPEPRVYRIENQLIAPIGILLPASKLIVHGQRDALLKLIAVIGSQTDNVASNLEAKREIEVLGHMAL